MKIIFMGTPEICIPCLDYLNNSNEVQLVQVISMPDRPAGRGKKLKSPEVIEFCKKNEIDFFQTENINKNINEIAECDVIIVFAFAQFLGQEILDKPKVGCFNIHTSLLPKYRGAAPIQSAVLNGDKISGVSIQKMVKKMDAGDICKSLSLELDEDETGGSLYQKLMMLSKDCLESFLKDLKDNKLSFEKQDESKVSFSPTISRDQGKIDFQSTTYEEIDRKIRAYDPWPGTFCYLNDKRLKLFKIEKKSEQLKPGECKRVNNELLVGAKDISVRLSEVQYEGKKRTKDFELLNGLKEELVIK